jgi:hypothetical protein
MQTDKLHTQTLDQGASVPKPHSLIGSDRVEGTPVRRSDGGCATRHTDRRRELGWSYRP